MSARHYHHGVVTLQGLEPRSSQVWRGVRLVPLVRTRPLAGLRLARVARPEPAWEQTRLAAHPTHPEREAVYASLVPHAFVLGWGEGDEAEAEVTQGAAFVREREGGASFLGGQPVRLGLRMARRLPGKRALRFAPQHLALEGLLSMFFAGPDIARREWSERVLRFGLDPRAERALSGAAMPHLAEALRVFELVEGQCGMLLFFADQLFGSFVAPTEGDYRAVHEALVLDLFPAELLFYAGYDAPRFEVSLDDAEVRTVGDLRAALAREERARSAFAAFTADALLRSALVQPVYTLDAFRLERFVTHLERRGEHHAGERVLARDGTVAYLKTYRLSTPQARRAYLLRVLADARWSLDDAVAATKMTREQLLDELERAGFGWLLSRAVQHERRRGR